MVKVKISLQWILANWDAVAHSARNLAWNFQKNFSHCFWWCVWQQTADVTRMWNSSRVQRSSEENYPANEPENIPQKRRPFRERWSSGCRWNWRARIGLCKILPQQRSVLLFRKPFWHNILWADVQSNVSTRNGAVKMLGMWQVLL